MVKIPLNSEHEEFGFILGQKLKKKIFSSWCKRRMPLFYWGIYNADIADYFNTVIKLVYL